MRLNYYQKNLMMSSSENYKETGFEWIEKYQLIGNFAE